MKNKNISIKVHMTTRKVSTRKKVFNFANALSKIVLVYCHTEGSRCYRKEMALRKRNYPFSPTWQVRGQTCSLLAE